MSAEEQSSRSGGSALESAVWGVVLVLVYALLVCLPLVLVAFRPGEAEHSPAYELGKSFALAGTAVLALQIVIAARLRWIERPFGLDRLFRFHRVMGLFGGLLILAHPILLAVGGAGWDLLYNVRQPWFLWLGKIALVLLILEVSIARNRARWGLEYESWRRSHNAGIVILGLVFVHSAVVGDELHGIPALWGLWWVYLVAAVAAYVYHRGVVPVTARRRAYRVREVKRETHDVWTLKMAPPEGRERFDYRPGQFQFLTLDRKARGLPVEEHPFTIASSPTEPELAASIKESGDFTATIGQTVEGDRVSIRGPYGRFSYTFRPEHRDLVFIAGGIGITPLLSMLRHMRDTEADTDVLLLWGNRTAADIAFQDELDDIVERGRPRLRVVHVLSQADENWPGETGFVDREKIERLVVEGWTEKTYYVCGPPVMMAKVFAALKTLGVPSRRILSERFAL